jgi:hypothetical protein
MNEEDAPSAMNWSMANRASSDMELEAYVLPGTMSEIRTLQASYLYDLLLLKEV